MQFDSLADVVSFGVAPAVLAYAWGVRSSTSPPAALRQLRALGWLCCLAFLICCAWRLARFNVQGMAPGGSKYFVGMPTPAAAGVIASMVHAFHAVDRSRSRHYYLTGDGPLRGCCLRSPSAH